MKRMMLALVTAVLMTTGSVYAQRPYDNNNRYNDRFENRVSIERRLDRWENELGITRRQKRELLSIENKFERRGFSREERRYPDAIARLEREKEREMLSVLTPRQREHFYQLERRQAYRPYSRRS